MNFIDEYENFSRIELISKRCSNRFLTGLSKLLEARKQKMRTLQLETHGEEDIDDVDDCNSLVDSVACQSEKSFKATQNMLERRARMISTPTLNEICELGRQCHILLHFKLENVDTSISILVDPERTTVSQLVKEAIDWIQVLEPIARGCDSDCDPDCDGDCDDDEEDDDEEDEDDSDHNPIPGHEEEDGDEECDEPRDQADELEHCPYAGSVHDDDAWQLGRLISLVDKAHLRFSLSPAETNAESTIRPLRVWTTRTYPQPKRQEFIKAYSWWPSKRSWNRQRAL